jgi:hypothetical protein
MLKSRREIVLRTLSNGDGTVSSGNECYESEIDLESPMNINRSFPSSAKTSAVACRVGPSSHTPGGYFANIFCSALLIRGVFFWGLSLTESVATPLHTIWRVWASYKSTTSVPIA